MKNNKKIYEGEDAVFNFLNPSSFSMTPLVELPSSLNKFKKDKVRIFIKLSNFLPLFNIKSVFAWEMLSGMSKEKLKNTKHLVEYSSGNTVLALTVLSKHFGIPNMHAIIVPDVPEEKKKIIKLVGAELLISEGPGCPDVFAKEGGVYEAKMLGKQKGWLNMNQYINPNSPLASEKYIGKEIWEQLNGGVSIFCSSIGTSGTIYGAGSYLKNKNKNILVVGASIKSGSSIPGPRSEEAIPKLGFPWSKTVDKTFAIDQVSAYEKSLELIRTGLFVGPSTGMQLAMINKMVVNMKKNRTLHKYKNKNGEIIITFIAGDTMFPYVNEYFSTLPKKYFKPEKILKTKRKDL
ncbi:MAG: pyridoxal-phosphate dependent enzyme [Candidatus Paceibacterota bacterium]|jgi:cysteine synthase